MAKLKPIRRREFIKQAVILGHPCYNLNGWMPDTKANLNTK